MENDWMRVYGEPCLNCNDRVELGSKHTCPYKLDIDGDEETLCNCCDNCKELCCDEI